LLTKWRCVDIAHYFTSQERQSRLQEWGFNCTCDLCRATAEERAISDGRRVKIAPISHGITAALEKWDIHKAIRIMEDRLVLLKEEGLEASSGEMHEGLARLYWILGDEEIAIGHARNAVDYADFGYLELRNRTAEVLEMLKEDA